MRKLLALVTLLGLITSCGKDLHIEESPIAVGIVMYNSVVGQNYVVMDPSNIAFRLNALILEGAGDPNATIAKTAKDKLFGTATITFDQATSTYTIEYPYGNRIDNDPPKVGQIQINTNGTTLGTMGANWNIMLDNLAYVSQNTISTGVLTYLITNTGSNSWTIDVKNYQSWSDPSYKAVWNCIYNLRQTKGADQTLSILKESEFMLSFSANNLKTMYTTVNYDVEVPAMMFSGKCPNGIITAGGSMTMKIVGNETSQGKAEISWMEGATGCKPKIKMTNNDVTEVLE